MTTPETPEPAMRPEDVPLEIADAFYRCIPPATLGNDYDAEIARIRYRLAAVLSAHRAMVLAEIAAEPPECVVVRRDDLEAYLNRGTGDVLREADALNRLLAAIGDDDA